MSFVAAFCDELTKVAAPRWLREWAKKGPGRAVSWNTPSGVVTGERLRQEIGYAPDHQGLVRTRQRTQAGSPSRAWIRFNGGASRAYDAATRLRFSGAHAVRPNEVGVPASFSGEQVANPLGGLVRPQFIYRGNAVNKSGLISTKGPSVVHGSRHPDVAANYALGRASMAQRPNRVVTAYSARRFIEGSADTVAHRLGARGVFYPNSGQASSASHAAGHAVSTYEAGVRQSALPRSVGRYAVRPATQQGRPVFALSRLSGLPTEKVFKPWIGGKS